MVSDNQSPVKINRRLFSVHTVQGYGGNASRARIPPLKVSAQRIAHKRHGKAWCDVSVLLSDMFGV